MRASAGIPMWLIAPAMFGRRLSAAMTCEMDFCIPSWAAFELFACLPPEGPSRLPSTEWFPPFRRRRRLSEETLWKSSNAFSKSSCVRSEEVSLMESPSESSFAAPPFPWANSPCRRARVAATAADVDSVALLCFSSRALAAFAFVALPRALAALAFDLATSCAFSSLRRWTSTLRALLSIAGSTYFTSSMTRARRTASAVSMALRNRATSFESSLRPRSFRSSCNSLYNFCSCLRFFRQSQTNILKVNIARRMTLTM